jgi:hypothetical protein
MENLERQNDKTCETEGKSMTPVDIAGAERTQWKDEI